MNAVVQLARFADGAVVRLTRWGVILGMITLFVLLLIRIVARATEIPFVAFDEIVELATVWMILLGVVAMWRAGSLYSVDFLVGRTDRATLALNFLVQVAMLAFAVVLIWQGTKFTMMNRNYSAFLLINMDYYFGAIPVAASVMAIYSLRSVVQRFADLVAGRFRNGSPGGLDAGGTPGHL